MKYTLLILFAFVSFSFYSCNDDDPIDEPMTEEENKDDHDDHDDHHDDTQTTDYQYHAHINSPVAGMKHLGETMDINATFESHAGETVHHVQVRIYEKDSGNEVYKKPNEAHVHATDGEFSFEDQVTLSTESGFSVGANYVLEAQVWGHEAEVGLVTETLEFNIHM